MRPLIWQIDFTKFMNVPVAIETNDGHVRPRTVITAVRWATVKFDTDEVQYPEELIFENDDSIPFKDMRTIRRIKPGQ